MSTLAAPATARTDVRRIAPYLGAIAFGLALFLATGFAWPSALHNATHDTRHSLGLPCH